MKNRRLLFVFLGLFATLLGPLKASENDPFVAKFGGPYKNGISVEFRLDLMKYAGGLRNAYAALGVVGLKDKETYNEFCKDFIDPSIAKLDPKTDAERKMKTAAIQVKEAQSFVADPASIPEDQRKSMADFLDMCVLPDENPTETNKVGGMLFRFSAHCMGMSLEKCMEATKKAKNPGK